MKKDRVWFRTCIFLALLGLVAALAAQTRVGLSQLPTQVQGAAEAATQTLGGDQLFQTHTVVLSSTNNPGLVYVGSANPSASGYVNGQLFVITVDTPNLAGATISINGVGPVALTGICNRVCIVLYDAQPSTDPQHPAPAAFEVH